MVKTAPGKMDRRSHQPEKDGSSGSGSRFKGVRMRKWGKWVAEVRLPNSRERIWLGSYNTPEQAARAYDAAVFCLRGPAATFNFPETPPDIPSAGTLNQIQIQAAAARYARAGSSSVEGGDSTTQHPMENQSPSATTVESLLSGDNWAFTEALFSFLRSFVD